MTSLKERINQLVRVHGSLRAVARATEIDIGYLSRLRSGKSREPGLQVLERLGLYKIVGYEGSGNE